MNTVLMIDILIYNIYMKNSFRVTYQSDSFSFIPTFFFLLLFLIFDNYISQNARYSFTCDCSRNRTKLWLQLIPYNPTREISCWKNAYNKMPPFSSVSAWPPDFMKTEQHFRFCLAGCAERASVSSRTSSCASCHTSCRWRQAD